MDEKVAQGGVGVLRTHAQRKGRLAHPGFLRRALREEVVHQVMLAVDRLVLTIRHCEPADASNRDDGAQPKQKEVL
jgi:hypothetical protein